MSGHTDTYTTDCSTWTIKMVRENKCKIARQRINEKKRDESHPAVSESPHNTALTSFSIIQSPAQTAVYCFHHE